jgi:hypothetical protein
MILFGFRNNLLFPGRAALNLPTISTQLHCPQAVYILRGA